MISKEGVRQEKDEGLKEIMKKEIGAIGELLELEGSL